MPLVWAHAEFLKLSRSIRDGRVFDLPAEAAERYLAAERTSPFAVWREGRELARVARGLTLRVESRAMRAVHWRVAGSEHHGCENACDLGIGINYADLPTNELPSGAEICFRTEPAGVTAGEHRVRIE
jgi:glucoamylase